MRAQIKADRRAKSEREKEAAVLQKAKNKELKEQREMQEFREEQADKALVKFGRDHLALLERVNGNNSREVKKATKELHARGEDTVENTAT
jgi:hypothetical protein